MYVLYVCMYETLKISGLIIENQVLPKQKEAKSVC